MKVNYISPHLTFLGFSWLTGMHHWTYPPKYLNININVLKHKKALTSGDLKFIPLSNFVFRTILSLEEQVKPV